MHEEMEALMGQSLHREGTLTPIQVPSHLSWLEQGWVVFPSRGDICMTAQSGSFISSALCTTSNNKLFKSI